MSPVAAENFARALQGESVAVIGPGDERMVLPMGEWLRDADEQDREFLAHCVGPTIDVGCGPGRMTAALAEAGHVTLGVDAVSEAVATTLRRGGVALHRDLHDTLPGEGRWGTALLVDGNIGIGGDPVGLLRRMRTLLAPGGRVVVEVEAPGVASESVSLQLDCDGEFSEPFPWSFVGADGIEEIGAEAGLGLTALHAHGTRWCAVLEVPA
ncbi:class I SAM-dependent methyltransferase [Nocardioides panacisoli]|uniref:class I SAM-dependent methyltransferase n=1 Tax=Nocardioides panacisoli TaxID=627624 RepID=UPI001C6281A1|nr:methyltransferase domain-containing protein [Nocardioides panacisoli]QYJ05291.1 class I SAM-dependent methyltransferase [Nocardioides panacisoli]